MISRTAKITFGLFLILCLSGNARVNAADVKTAPAAAIPQQPGEEVVAHEVEGTVNALSSNFLAIGYGRDAKSGAGLEMAFDLDQAVRVSHKNSMKDIQVGDTVKVVYEDRTKIDSQGNKMYNRATKIVVFLRAAEKKAAPKEEIIPGTQPAPQDAAAQSSASPNEGSIPLKGLRGEGR